MPDTTIISIDHNSKYLKCVMDLWRPNASTLGFFPDGAFKEYAAKKQIIVALNSKKDFLGYLLFRITPSRQEASIVHLCVAVEKQGQGIAKALVKELIKITDGLRGISLRCRRDFKANNLWPKLNFSAASESEGKSNNGSILTRWWYQHKVLDLFTSILLEDFTDKLRVVIDANIFYDLKNKSDDESMALRADYLADSIAICITTELFNEIDRSPNQKERETSRNFASQFHHLVCSLDDFDQVYNTIKSYLPANPRPQDNSDFSHLARAIQANAKFFVTRDGAILDKGNELYQQFGISVIRPVDLIIEIDSLYREQEYQPARLAGTLCEIAKVQSGQEDLLVNAFQNHACSESQYSLRKLLRNLLISPLETDCLVAWSHSKEPIGLVAYNQNQAKCLNVKLFRVSPTHKLSTTILRYLIGFLMKKARSEGCRLIEILDLHLSQNAKEALIRDHFFPTNNSWFKFIIPAYTSKDHVLTELTKIDSEAEIVRNKIAEIKILLSSDDALQSPINIWNLEAVLWPAKITGSSIPCYIVPIRPEWALHLFDEEFANQDMFGAKIDLALSRESVYYRAAKNSAGISAPARILWYVSQKNSKHHGAGAIRAQSRLDEIIIGKPKDLYKQFRRLGIYEWKDVFLTAKENISNEIMALRFSETEMLNKPLPWDEVTKKLELAGIRTQLQSPCKIPENVFFSIISNL